MRNVCNVGLPQAMGDVISSISISVIFVLIYFSVLVYQLFFLF